MDHKAIREALEAYHHMLNNGHSSGYAFSVVFADLDPVGCIESLLADLDAKAAEVEREAFMAGYAAQEQLYVERERHTAEVKKLQALRPVAMTEEQRKQVFRAAEDRMVRQINLSWRDAVVECVEAHHGITQKGGKDDRT